MTQPAPTLEQIAQYYAAQAAAGQPAAAAQPPLPRPPPAPAAAPTNPGAVPASAVPHFVATQQSQPAPINPPEAVAALDPNAPPPVERSKRGGRKPKAPASVVGEPSALAAPVESAEDATTETLVNLLNYRGYDVTLIARQGNRAE